MNSPSGGHLFALTQDQIPQDPQHSQHWQCGSPKSNYSEIMEQSKTNMALIRMNPGCVVPGEEHWLAVRRCRFKSGVFNHFPTRY